MTESRTLTARFGTLYASVILIVAGVGIASTIHLGRIDTDSERVMEEVREEGVLMRAGSRIDTLLALIETTGELDEQERVRSRELIRATLEELDQLDEAGEDPSRPEHQSEEDVLTDRIREHLDAVDGALTGDPHELDTEGLRATLTSAGGIVDTLWAEAQEEADEAVLDLQQRTVSMRRTLITTSLAAFVLLGLALLSVHLKVVRPLRVLQAGARRFGQREFQHRVEVVNRDEIGELASTLNRMADDLRASHEHLEERVRARTSESLRLARLADLGILASGIAHEINTPLASIASCAEGLERRVRKDELTPELLAEYSETIRGEAYRARGITTRMLALVRQEPSTPTRISLQLILDQAVSALRLKAEQRGVRLIAEPLATDVELNVNGGELVQILVNLLANALDASPRDTEVHLEAEVRGEQLSLIVEDQGSGIPEEHLEQIFEPFYTTKPPGEGTGLGLALVMRMIESRRGHIEVKSEEGVGSTFSVTLPIDWRTQA